MTTFVDTSALYAILDRDDANHRRAGVVWHRLLEDEQLILTSNYILVETSALVQHRLGLQAVRTLYDSLVPVLNVHWVSEEEHGAAVTALMVAGRRRLSLVDCTSFEVMRRLDVAKSFAFDRHFRDRGIELLS